MVRILAEGHMLGDPRGSLRKIAVVVNNEMLHVVVIEPRTIARETLTPIEPDHETSR